MRHHRHLPLLMFLASSAAVAADVDLTMHVGDTYTDNALRTPDGPSDNIGAVAARLDLSAQGAHYETDLRSAVTLLHYFQGTQDDEVLRGFSGDVTFFIVPNRLNWVVQENYGPVLENPLSPDRPDNWTYDSYFTTGPDLQIGDDGQFHVRASARYSRADYEVELTPGNQQYAALVSFLLPGTVRNEKSLQISSKRVEQDALNQPPVPLPANGYDVQEAYLRWANELRRGGFYIDAGSSWVSDDGVTNSSPLVRVGLDRTISRSLTLSLSLGTQYSDDLRRFARLQDDAPGVDDPRGDLFRNTGPLQEEYADVTLQFTGGRTVAALRVAHNRLVSEDGFSTSAPDQEYSNATFDLERQITPRLSLQMGAALDRRDYGQLDRTDDDLFAFLTGAWRISREIEARLTGRFNKRDSSDPTADYTEKSIQLEFVYFAFERKEPRRNQKFLNRDLR
jgi:hypothetical protein